MRMDAYGRTDIGKVRKRNEDSFIIDPEIRLLVVADGMGGHSSGDVASRMAVETVRDAMKRFFSDGARVPILGKVDPKASESANRLAASVRLSNQIIYETARSKPQHQGMGTTIDCVLIHQDGAAIAHVGDSRVYLVRNDALNQLTEDHSLLGEQKKQGTLAAGEGARLQNILTRALGVDADTEVDIIETDLRPGDFLVACTDGLNKVVPDSRILETVGRMKTPKMIAEHLVDLANAGGGVDNTTVVVARMEK